MRSVLILFCFVVFSAFSAAAYAEEPATQIITNQEKGTITFIIDGKLVAQINRDGLHVVENINYGGAVTGSGPAYVKEIIEDGGKDVE